MLTNACRGLVAGDVDQLSKGDAGVSQAGGSRPDKRARSTSAEASIDAEIKRTAEVELSDCQLRQVLDAAPAPAPAPPQAPAPAPAATQAEVPARWRPGSLLWVKQRKAPWWPAIVTCPPSSTTHYRWHGRGFHLFHVQFFLTSPMRAWISAKHLRPWDGPKGGGDELRSDQTIPKRYLADWPLALEQAENAFGLSIDQRLQKFAAANDGEQKEEKEDGDPGDDLEVQRILDKRTGRTGTEYQVLWKGYPLEQATWEPKSNLNCGRLIEQFEAKRKADFAVPAAEPQAAGSHSVAARS